MSKKTAEIRDLAIKRHDIDASFFQQTYNDIILAKKAYPFKIGRSLVMEDIEECLNNLPGGARILDLGSGTGHLTKWMAEKGFMAEGVEPSSNMINNARTNFPDLRFTEGISSNIPVADNTFDFVISFEVFRYLDKDENQKSFEEVLRVLKPGGVFFFTQVNKYATDFYYPFYYLKKVVYGLTKTVYHYCFFTTPAEQEKMMLRAGYSQVKTIGRMASTIRIAYKLGKGFGDFYTKLIKMVYGNQKFIHSPLKAMSGHLVVIGKK
jgi:ubiquinone/menaquinone biosynthesis C-methylase UbiE